MSGRRDRGSSTVTVLALTAVALLLAVALLAWAGATQAAQRAGTAADLAALAAADTVRGLRPGDPCVVAAQVATANAADLAACLPGADGTSVTVAVTVRAPLGVGPGRIAQARARAGAPPLDAPRLDAPSSPG